LDCFVQLSGAERDQLISRHHCQLEIDPPAVRVRDLGSTNGTFLNGTGVETILKELPEKPGSLVKDGSFLTVGGTTLKVDIVDCPHAGNDAAGQAIWQAGETAKKDCPLTC